MTKRRSNKEIAPVADEPEPHPVDVIMGLVTDEPELEIKGEGVDMPVPLEVDTSQVLVVEDPSASFLVEENGAIVEKSHAQLLTMGQHRHKET